jgi:hypothetical protein
MAIQAILGAANMALSAAPLFFGENNIFSGKARQASKMLERNFNQSQAMGVPTEMTQALQNRLAQANTGIPGAALGLYQQQAGRAQASQLGALGSRRSALAGIGNIAQSGQDAALRLAGMQGEALQAGQENANQALMQMGQFKYQDQLRKQQEAADYWGTRKAESNAAISSALSAVGQAAGSALGSGAFNKTPGMPATTAAAVARPGIQSVSNTSTFMNAPGINILNRISGTPNLNQTSMFNMFNPGFKAPSLSPTRLTSNMFRSFPNPQIPSYIGG